MSITIPSIIRGYQGLPAAVSDCREMTCTPEQVRVLMSLARNDRSGWDVGFGDGTVTDFASYRDLKPQPHCVPV